ncbi:MAG: hypothetical protein J5U17_06175 [Candidatus Methanoperedens sp.]|nr:hypothetical protein [Candidatus Methanoperedens sp.]
MAAFRKAQINAADPNQETGAPVLEGPFVLHEHWWGEKHHFDLRFEKTNSEGKKVMIGFTLFANSLDDFESRLADGEKILAKEKDYHAPEWLTFHGEIPPGQSGNPTKNLVAHMEIRDTGHYAFAKRDRYDILVDPSSVTVDIFDTDGNKVSTGSAARECTGNYYYTYTIPTTAVSGSTYTTRATVINSSDFVTIKRARFKVRC